MNATSAVVIIDSGGANLASLQYALDRLQVRSLVSSDPAQVRGAARVLLPGVGAAADAMGRLRRAGLIDTLRALTVPVLGICLGMQLLYERSEEGDTRCLGILPGNVRRLVAAPGRPVPHMGWNSLVPLAADPLLAGVGARDYVYFVHGYAVPVGPETLAAVDYGTAHAAVVRHANFRGVQFHPERSGAVGARLLRNFLEIT
ncbi:MAG: imidazole glycerol phosphate synthase subunit HisH [Gammaproteobacteria bacterium]|nr:imidazole glycerol phosphate synthase subunit HisH [Gammaproteobacteria bacterium]